MRKYFTFVLLSALAFASCLDSKESIKQELENLCEEVETNSASYNTDDWHSFIVRYQEADSLLSLHESEYTDEELKEIGRIKGRCAAYLVKAAMVEGEQKIQNATKQVKGMIEGFIEGMSEE